MRGDPADTLALLSVIFLIVTLAIEFAWVLTVIGVKSRWPRGREWVALWAIDSVFDPRQK